MLAAKRIVLASLEFSIFFCITIAYRYVNKSPYQYQSFRQRDAMETVNFIEFFYSKKQQNLQLLRSTTYGQTTNRDDPVYTRNKLSMRNDRKKTNNIDDDEIDFAYELQQYSEEADNFQSSNQKLSTSLKNSSIISSSSHGDGNAVVGGRHFTDYATAYFKTTNANRNFLKKRNEYRYKSNNEPSSNKVDKPSTVKFSSSRNSERSNDLHNF